MTKREAAKLAKQIERDDSQCDVTNINAWPSVYRPRVNFYTLRVVDARTGYSFIVRDADDWAERKASTI